ncbi:hypothetical protein [Clostridium pasteurianum]|uniref:Uncharacterized protein n=1 Tax=Clostridium pasteurianum BC1 TaxID=86416 RepID=R4K494_CLOPA|nr:hypothetical protein [Clostridium pasteurianum]AGK97972.1 hypothetical protein Clopa_3158 [Clostridium pasteurianum BC1]
MIRKLLEKQGLKMSDQEFNEVMQETQNDIRENHLRFGVRTSRKYLLKVAIIYYGISKSI